MKWRRWLPILLVLVIVGFGWRPAQAASSSKPAGLEITPLRSYPSQPPGSTTSGKLFLTNRTSGTLNVAMSAEVFRTVNEDYDYSFDGPGKGDADWVKFKDTNVVLTANQSKTVEYDLAVPADASPGGHYLTLIATVAPVQNNGVTEISRVASLVYLEVSGQLVKNGNLLSSNLPSFSLSRQLPLDVRIQNGGNTHFQARIGVVLKPLLGASQNLTTLTGYILPSTVRHLGNTVTLPTMPGIYHVNLDFSPPQGGHDTPSFTVIYTPVWFLVLLAVALFFIALWTWGFLYRRHHQKRHKRTGLGPKVE